MMSYLGGRKEVGGSGSESLVFDHYRVGIVSWGRWDGEYSWRSSLRCSNRDSM